MGYTMKNLALFCGFLLILSLISCNENEPTSPVGDDQVSGKLFLKIDKVNAPAGVMWIEAFLTREGYDTITSTMNILTDSTADILLENIHAGEWHLKVDAKDSLNVILYSGETDIQILAGFTTQVYLVLEPTGEGEGNIYIWVTWGTPSGSWMDYTGNPILITSGSYWNYSGVSQPKVLNDNGLFEMYFTAQGSAYSGYIGRAYSSDGIIWTIDTNSPVLSPGSSGSWDETAVAAATVIKEGSSYKMFYHGWSDPWGPWHIGLATSADGINWVKHLNPVIYSAGGMEYQLAPSCVTRIDSTYYLYYSGLNLPFTDIRLATSVDGINWTKYSGNPILAATQSWEGNGIYYPTIYQVNDDYVMIFMSAGGTGFGRATSTDGINWTKDAANPFFTKEDTHNHWANYKIAYPNYIKINNEDRIYYTGFNLNGSPYSIGFVKK